MFKNLICVVFLTTFTTVFSQVSEFSTDELAVKKTIDQLFTGMQKGDSAMVRNAFHSSSRMMTCYIGRDGQSYISEDPLIDVLQAVAGAKENEWNEKIISYSIFIDLNLAQVWTNYEFYFQEKFSHCGVNAFQLVLVENEWKIFQLSDTRKTDGCQ
jgi:hypothetical protein